MKRNCILRRGEILINFAFEPGEFPLFLGMAAMAQKKINHLVRTNIAMENHHF